jgi:hypothetical protein
MSDGASESPDRVAAADDPSHTLVFLDTETTGLHCDRRPWEIAIIRRDRDGPSRLLLCVDIEDLDLPTADPIGLLPRTEIGDDAVAFDADEGRRGSSA